MEDFDKDDFKQIFRDHWNNFKSAHPKFNTDYHDNVVQKMLDCGDPDKMGCKRSRGLTLAP